jgi:putative PIN family toxin of toxin-antitoxin system
LELISLNAEMVNPVRFVKPVCTDHDDDKFLEAAITAKADYVVTGDKALLFVGSLKGTSVVKPSEFLNSLR